MDAEDTAAAPARLAPLVGTWSRGHQRRAARGRWLTRFWWLDDGGPLAQRAEPPEGRIEPGSDRIVARWEGSTAGREWSLDCDAINTRVA